MSNPLLCRDSSRTRARAHCSSACDSECFRFCTNNFTTIKVYCEILKNSSETPSNTEFCVLEHSHTGNYTTFWITVNVASVEATKGSENNSFQKIRAKELESCSAIGCFVVVSTWKLRNSATYPSAADIYFIQAFQFLDWVNHFRAASTGLIHFGSLSCTKLLGQLYFLFFRFFALVHRFFSELFFEMNFFLRHNST